MNEINGVRVIYKFKRNKHGKAIGCILVCKHPDPNLVWNGSDPIWSVGWSLCSPTAKDKFNKQRALDIAFGRAYKMAVDDVPSSLKVDVAEMAKRANRYFKD